LELHGDAPVQSLFNAHPGFAHSYPNVPAVDLIDLSFVPHDVIIGHLPLFDVAQDRCPIVFFANGRWASARSAGCTARVWFHQGRYSLSRYALASSMRHAPATRSPRGGPAPSKNWRSTRPLACVECAGIQTTFSWRKARSICVGGIGGRSRPFTLLLPFSLDRHLKHARFSV